MTIKSPATGSRTQEPLRFPGLSKPPTSDLISYVVLIHTAVVDDVVVDDTKRHKEPSHATPKHIFEVEESSCIRAYFSEAGSHNLTCFRQNVAAILRILTQMNVYVVCEGHEL
jgi:hypothetical protein